MSTQPAEFSFTQIGASDPLALTPLFSETFFMRTFLRFAVPAALAVAFLGTTNVAAAKLMIAPSPPAKRALMADVVVVGKVTAIAKDPVSAMPPYAGAKEKVNYQIATITVDTGLIGADKLKEIKVGTQIFPKPDPKAPRIGGLPNRRFGFELKEESLKKYPFGGTRPMARVYHEDASVAEW